MKFALILLVILAIACTAGSIIPQNDTLAYYTEAYSEQTAKLIMATGMNDVFHCWWFVLLAVILCGNLLGCNLIHFPSLIKRTREGFRGENALKRCEHKAIRNTEEPEKLFEELGFRKISSFEDGQGRSCLYAVKNKAGIWGAWLTHLGMLIIIIGFGLGQVFKTEYTVYGIPGQTKPIGETGYELTIDDFHVELRDDETVEQYTAKLTMTNTVTGERGQGEACVNSPLSLFGMKLYQNSTGWAATMEIKKDGQVIQEDSLCAGEFLPIEERPEVVVMLSAFYPDYVAGENGTPMTASSSIKNPGYLYMLYNKGQMLGMNVLTEGEVITAGDYEIRFKDPQSYTLIQIKRDPFTGVAAVGGLIILAALILAFYLRTAEIWAVRNEDGSWEIGGYSRKGGEDFTDRIRLAGKQKKEA